jgi:hypothetical protein
MIRDLSRVRLTKDAGRFGEYPAGRTGTVVHAYPDGEAYEVEFTYSGPAGRDAYSEVITVKSDSLELDNNHKRP